MEEKTESKGRRIKLYCPYASKIAQIMAWEDQTLDLGMISRMFRIELATSKLNGHFISIEVDLIVLLLLGNPFSLSSLLGVCPPVLMALTPSSSTASSPSPKRSVCFNPLFLFLCFRSLGYLHVHCGCWVLFVFLFSVRCRNQKSKIKGLMG